MESNPDKKIINVDPSFWESQAEKSEKPKEIQLYLSGWIRFDVIVHSVLSSPEFSERPLEWIQHTRSLVDKTLVEIQVAPFTETKPRMWATVVLPGVAQASAEEYWGSKSLSLELEPSVIAAALNYSP